MTRAARSDIGGTHARTITVGEPIPMTQAEREWASKAEEGSRLLFERVHALLERREKESVA